MKKISLKYFLLGCILLVMRKYFAINKNILNINCSYLGYERVFRIKYGIKEKNISILDILYKYIHEKYFTTIMSTVDIIVSLYLRDIKYFIAGILLPYDISSIENLFVLLLFREQWYSLLCGIVLSLHSFYYIPFLFIVCMKYFKKNKKFLIKYILIYLTVISYLIFKIYKNIYNTNNIYDEYNSIAYLQVYKYILLLPLHWYNNYKDLYEFLHYPSQNMFWYFYMHMFNQYSKYLYAIYTVTYFFIFSILPFNISYVHFIVLLFFKPCNYKNFLILPFLENCYEGWPFFCVVGFLQMFVNELFCSSLIGNTNFIYWLNLVWYLLVFIVISCKYEL